MIRYDSELVEMTKVKTFGLFGQSIAWFWLATHGNLMVYYCQAVGHAYVMCLLLGVGFSAEVRCLATINQLAEVVKLVLETGACCW